MLDLATRTKRQKHRIRLHKVCSLRYLDAARRSARAAISWLVVLALLHATLLPFAPAVQAARAIPGLSAELEATRIALGATPESFSAFLCHDDGSVPATPSGGGGDYPDKSKCPVCQAAQHLAYGLPPAEGLGTPFFVASTSLSPLALTTIVHPHALGLGKPRAPPLSLFGIDIV